jgi:hypothetical protein
LTLGLRIGAAMIFHRRRGALQKNEQCVQSNCCDHSNRDCCAFAHGSGGGRKWFSRGGRARRIWRRSYCGQRARSADGVCRTATARLLRATSSCGLCRSTDAGVCRAGVNGPATSRSSPLTPSAKTGFSWCGLAAFFWLPRGRHSASVMDFIQTFLKISRSDSPLTEGETT